MRGYTDGFGVNSYMVDYHIFMLADCYMFMSMVVVSITYGHEGLLMRGVCGVL